jgi:hypothetical protein
MEITKNINQWLQYGNRGISSETIVTHLTGVHIVNNYFGLEHPHDPSDLNRCVELMKTAPEIKEEFYRMKEVSNIWSVLVDHWDELVLLMEKEKEQNNGRCTKTYQRMKELGC